MFFFVFLVFFSFPSLSCLGRFLNFQKEKIPESKNKTNYNDKMTKMRKMTNNL